MESEAYHLALLMVRVGLGITLAAHGYNKFFGGGRIPGTAGWFSSIGMKHGKFQAVLAATVEIGAGIFFAAGLLTSFAAAGFVGLMVVAALLVHLKSGFFIVSGGWEYNFVLALVPTVVAMTGPGDWSLDNAIRIEDLQLSATFDGWWGLIISGGGGVVASLLLLAVFYRPKAPASASDSSSNDSSPSNDSSE